MKGNSVQEVCEDQLSEMSSQAASNNEASNTSSGPKLALDLSLTVTAAATTAEWSTTDSNGAAQAAREPTRVFTCNYRQWKFFSSQALGGHQNAHRQERTLPRRALHQLEAYPYGYADVASLPLYGSPGLYLIGIQAHAWVHPAAAQAERQQQQDVAVLAAPARARGRFWDQCRSSWAATRRSASGAPTASGHHDGAPACSPSSTPATTWASSGNIVVQADEEPDMALTF